MLAAVRSIAKSPACSRAMCTATGPKAFFFKREMDVPRATGALRHVVGDTGSAEVVAGSPHAATSLFRSLLMAAHPRSEEIDAVSLKLNAALHLGENQFSLQGNVTAGELPATDDSWKVGRSTVAGKLAGAIAARLRAEPAAAVAIDSIGWRNHNKAVTSVFLAQRFMHQDEEPGAMDVYMTRGGRMDDDRFSLRLVVAWNPEATAPTINEELILTRSPQDSYEDA